MSLTSRVLPVQEWDKLLAFEPYATQGLPPDEHWIITAVERDGRLIACSAIFDTVHWDIFQILPEEQGNPAVAKHLILASLRTLDDLGVSSVHLTLDEARTDLVGMAEHLGFVRSPLTLYIRAIPPKED